MSDAMEVVIGSVIGAGATGAVWMYGVDFGGVLWWKAEIDILLSPHEHTHKVNPGSDESAVTLYYPFVCFFF